MYYTDPYTDPFRRSADPFALMRSMLRDLDSFTAPFSSPFFGFAPQAAGGRAFPALNIWQGDEAVAITAQVPGVDPADLDIAVKGNVLTISGERRPPEVPEDARWHLNERSYGRFTRSIRLPFTATDDKVEARMANGVLRVIVGRPDEDKPRKIQIKAA